MNNFNEEIRIGNVLSYDNELIVVFDISRINGEFFITYLKNHYSSAIGGMDSYLKFNPIPLNNTIMGKCLHHIDGIHWGVEHENIEHGVMFRLEMEDGIPTYVLCADYGFPVTKKGIRYLHELQNLYLELTKEQLNTTMLWTLKN